MDCATQMRESEALHISDSNINFINFGKWQKLFDKLKLQSFVSLFQTLINLQCPKTAKKAKQSRK